MNAQSSRQTAAPTRRYAGKSSEQRSAERRERLLEVALEEFATNGFRNTRIESLCRISSVTTRYFYQLFGSREALLEALYNQITCRIAEQVQTALNEAPEDHDERARIALTTLVHELFEDPRRARIVFLESNGVSQELDERHRSRAMKFVHLIEDETLALVQHGQLKPADYHPLALALVGASMQVMQAWVLENEEAGSKALVERLVELFAVMREGICNYYGQR